MPINHFEKGKNVTVQFVNVGIQVNEILNYLTVATNVIHSFTVPANKKWTIYRIGAHRVNVGDIDIYLYDPAPSLAILDQVSADFHLTVKEPFTISSGWKISVEYLAGVSGILRSYLLYAEEPE